MTENTSYKKYTHYLPEVKHYLNALQEQDLWWSTVSMVGKINNENMDPQLLVDIVETQKAFQTLRDLMMNSLVERHLNQANSEITLLSRATIDILNRNLFERTADVGFLATDEDLVEFLTKPETSEQENAFIHRRIEEYVAKYSVYNDILLISPAGEIKAKLNDKNPVVKSHDPLISKALHSNEDFIEEFRYSDLFPTQSNSLIYAKRFENPKAGNTAVGVLVMSFNFENEMQTIFNLMNSEHAEYQISLLNDKGTIIASNHPNQNPLGKTLAAPSSMSTPKISDKGLYQTTKTTGYQGFSGLAWFCMTSATHKVAFGNGSAKESLNIEILPNSALYLKDLDETNIKVSTLLLIVILNGKITSLKKDVKSFLPILDSFQNISKDIEEIFRDFINHIHNVLVKTIQDKVSFSAKLAIEIMDRNLYERANDCRWWALNSSFRQILTSHQETKPIGVEQTKQLSEILHYINQLYTVYTNILLYDNNGKVLAVSNKSQTHLIGNHLPTQQTQSCLALNSTQQYIVSNFESTELYDNRHTYLYHAPVKHWEKSNQNVGGIALVFDSEPEFKAMLLDTQPKYINKEVDQATFCLFTTRQGFIISSTHENFPIGTTLNLPNKLSQASNADTGSIYWEYQGKPYIIGYKMSEGYREYKTSDGYQNDVLALVFTGI